MNTPNTDPVNSETVREREVIVTDNGGGNSSATLVIAILAIAALALIGFFVLNSDAADTVVPDEINVNVDDSTGSSDSSSTDAEPEA